jgi:Arc/MetJ-type ribon-helix-helix transcriptional regulator
MRRFEAPYDEFPMRDFSPALQTLIDEHMRGGDYRSVEDVLTAGLLSLRQQRDFGDFATGELQSLVDEGEQQIERHGTVSGEAVFDEIRRMSDDRRAGR